MSCFIGGATLILAYYFVGLNAGLPVVSAVTSI